MHCSRSRRTPITSTPETNWNQDTVMPTHAHSHTFLHQAYAATTEPPAFSPDTLRSVSPCHSLPSLDRKSVV